MAAMAGVTPNLPDNPFPALQLQLEEAGIYGLLPGEPQELVAITVLLGISLIMTIVALAGRYRAGRLWFFKRDGLQITAVNGVNCYLVSSFLFNAFVPSYIWTTNFMMTILIWIILWQGRWLYSWATLLALHASSRPSEAVSRAVNIFFLIMPFLLLAALLPFSILSNIYSNRGDTVYAVLDNALTVATAQYNNGTYVDDGNIALLFADVTYEYTASALWSQDVWITWAVFTAVELVVFLVITYMYHRSIRISLRPLQEQAAQNTNGGYSNSAKISNLNNAVRGLLFSSALSTIIALAHVWCCCWIAGAFGDVEYARMVGLWAYTLCGALISNAVILIRDFNLSTTLGNNGATNSKTGTTSKTEIGTHGRLSLKPGVGVKTMVMVTFDDGEPDDRMNKHAKGGKREESTTNEFEV